eukprot:2854107-Prymnesium_polylepis.1
MYVSELTRALDSCGVRWSVHRSGHSGVEAVGTDLCYMATADYFLPTIGSLSQLVHELRQALDWLERPATSKGRKCPSMHPDPAPLVNGTRAQ